MNLCRICLSTSPNKDIYELKMGPKHDRKSYSDIFLFCLNIQVTKSSDLASKLCSKCYRRILEYYKFKTLALKNDTYLKTLKLDSTVKQETYVHEDHEFSNNNFNFTQVFNNEVESIEKGFDNGINSTDTLYVDVKEDQVIKVENSHDIYENEHKSDDELLSVIKQIKETSCSTINSIHLEGADKVKAKSKGRLKKIKTEPFAPKKRMCEECGEYVKDLKQHSVRHLPLEDRRRIPCQLCDKSFCSYGARNKHKRLIHYGIKHQCQECGKEVANLKNHLILKHHPELAKIKCPLCDKGFISQSLYDIHMLKHTKDKPNECDICKKRFGLKTTLELHKRQVHEQEKSHLCQYCPKTFFKKYHLDVHVRTHTKEKPYNCEECGRAFRDSTTLKNHQTTHVTERNFQCDHCDMKFVRREYLRVHLVCHTKERRFPCKYCGVRFGRSDHRKRHEFTAHEKHLLHAAL